MNPHLVMAIASREAVDPYRPPAVVMLTSAHFRDVPPQAEIVREPFWPAGRFVDNGRQAWLEEAEWGVGTLLVVLVGFTGRRVVLGVQLEMDDAVSVGIHAADFRSQ